MPKYEKLSRYLATTNVEQATLTFAEIEGVIGFSLPRSAHTYPAWWSNQASPGHSQSSAWQSVGWRTGEVNLSVKKVSFFRVRPNLAGAAPSDDTSRRGITPSLTCHRHEYINLPLLDFSPLRQNVPTMTSPWDWDNIVKRANARSYELYNKAAVTYFKQQGEEDLLNLHRPPLKSGIGLLRLEKAARLLKWTLPQILGIEVAYQVASGRNGLTIAEAKAELSAHFGVPLENVEITIKG
jgi:hypothetical protein